MQNFLKAIVVSALLVAGQTGCSDASSSAAAPKADSVTETKSKIGKETPAGVGVMPKEPGR